MKSDLAQFGLKRDDVKDRERWCSQVKAKIANPGCQDIGLYYIILLNVFKRLINLNF